MKDNRKFITISLPTSIGYYCFLGIQRQIREVSVNTNYIINLATGLRGHQIIQDTDQSLSKNRFGGPQY